MTSRPNTIQLAKRMIHALVNAMLAQRAGLQLRLIANTPHAVAHQNHQSTNMAEIVAKVACFVDGIYMAPITHLHNTVSSSRSMALRTRNSHALLLNGEFTKVYSS